MAFSKQYCLTPSEARGSCIAWASLKTGVPKLSAALNFLWLLSLFQDKESNIKEKCRSENAFKHFQTAL
jgi:hypothetical protein